MTITSERKDPMLIEKENVEGASIEKTNEENIVDKMKEQVDKLTPKETHILEPKAHHKQTLGIVSVSQEDISRKIYGKKRGQNVFHSV